MTKPKSTSHPQDSERDSKPKNAKPDPASTAAPPTGHAWHGGGVEPAPHSGEEAPEAAAARAEGNAPLSREAAAESARQAQDFSTYDPLQPKADPPDDSAENLDEKQEAAREAHAEESSRHAPHGKL